ncbi:MAG TPA: spore cortex-lytic enzyme [Clostridiaceae bacterium]|nr:spore cortex-lytic enzyme [Clostridiaceae bacterium]
MFKKKLLLFFLAFIICTIAGAAFLYNEGLSGIYGFPLAALSQYGSRGDEVFQIQRKLSNWGYYDGPIDGIYGYKTYSAVRWFQSKNGLKVDGIAGPQTLAAMGIVSGSKASASGSNKDVNLLAHIIYGEARGEPYAGQVAVAAVVLNRTRDSRFPNTIAGVIYQPGAFDAVSDGQINLPPDGTAFKAARDALNGWDPSGGAIYYWNPATATSKWIWSRKVVAKIGKHWFGI